MKIKIIMLALVLIGCKQGPQCKTYTITSSDNGICWKQCAQAAAISGHFEWNFKQCVDTGCNYPKETVCK